MFAAVLAVVLHTELLSIVLVMAQTDPDIALDVPDINFIIQEGCKNKSSTPLPSEGVDLIPWIVRIVNRMDANDMRRCVGALITPTHILTTAYCLKTKRPYRDRRTIRVYLTSIEDDYTPKVCSLYIHPKYRIHYDSMGHVTLIRNNIGIISLTENFPPRRIFNLPQTTVCLARDRFDLLFSRTTHTISWGFFTSARVAEGGGAKIKSNRASIIHPVLCLSAAAPEYFCVELPARNLVNDFCYGDDGAVINLLAQNRFVQYGMVAFPFGEKVCTQVSPWVINVSFHELFIQDAVGMNSECGTIPTKFPNYRKYPELKEILIN